MTRRKTFRDRDDSYPEDFSTDKIRICDLVSPFTMTTPERIGSLLDAIDYIHKNKISGSFVECGVWKGGSSMAAALRLKELGDTTRDIFLYDTFTGMPEPGSMDISQDGTSALAAFKKQQTEEDQSDWCRSDLEDVRHNLFSTGYPREKLHFIKGKVEQTIPDRAPAEIALLRLDTDWYQSTLHELEHLYPRLPTAAILIIDDYGYWAGAKKAVDEYFMRNQWQPLLHRIDQTGRILIK